MSSSSQRSTRLRTRKLMVLWVRLSIQKTRSHR
jgi:hypothetical protein